MTSLSVGNRFVCYMQNNTQRKYPMFITTTQEELQDKVNRLVDIGRKYSMEIDVDKSQVMRVSWRSAED